ncbi:hypothetical protein [Paucibacter sp. KCTC 42545]|uniref:hypothetical protein n=1 Tax=Paucibacter sp. KCTC 42545 TaxID=1768242 RepID=UPI000733B268|nr:hypothetical protein [Paucibacter sp. KCTC 42545]ALT75921.1 hypothetical protein AT984_00490 [Paucibacter sp. KCTC 42545]
MKLSALSLALLVPACAWAAKGPVAPDAIEPGSSAAKPADSTPARLGASRPAAVEMNWTPISLPDGGKTAMLGGSYLMAVDDSWGFGPSAYVTAKGNYGGIFTLGLTAQRRWNIGSSTHFAAGLYVGAGGGLSSEKLRFGGGLMLRPELSIRTEMGDWYAGVGVAMIRFPSGTVSDTSYTVVLGKANNFASFLPSDSGRRGRAGARTGLGFDEVMLYGGVDKPSSRTQNRSGVPSTGRMGKAGADLRQYIADGSWWGVEAAGAAQGGADGYMEILANAGQDWAIGSPKLRLGGQLGLGLGGGGNVDTGNGWLLRAGPSLRWVTPWGPSLRLEAGWTQAVTGHFSGSFVRLGLGMPLDITPSSSAAWGSGDVDQGVVRTSQIFASVVHLPDVLFKDGTREAISQYNMILTRELSPHVYGVAQAGSAAVGRAGAYSIGLFGMGVQSEPWGAWRLGAEALVGAAGGGGVAVGGGAVGQGELWAQWEGERLRLRAGLGQWRSLRHAEQSSPLFSVSVGYAYGTLAR